MRFHTEHHFAGSADAVMAVLVDPAFHRQLSLPDLSLPEVLGAEANSDETVLQLRYEYIGQLDPIARRLLGDRKLTWLQELRLDQTSGAGSLGFQAEAAPDRLRGSARFTVEPADGPGSSDDDSGSVRRLDGELVVAVRPIGGMAERRIVPGLLRRLDIEAQAVDDHLRG